MTLLFSSPCSPLLKTTDENALPPQRGSSLIRRVSLFQTLFALYVLVHCPNLQGQAASFHGAPESAKDLTYPSNARSAENGKPLYEQHCASCHGAAGEGSGNVPSLRTAAIKSASPGELFWFISKGVPK